MLSFKPLLKTSLVSILTALAVYLAAVNLSDRLNQTLPSDGVQWSQDEEGIVVGRVAGWPGLRPQPDLQPGDRLLNINGVPVTTLDEYTELVETLAGFDSNRIRVHYQILKVLTGEKVSVPVRFEALGGLTSFHVYLLIIGALNLAAGVMISIRNRGTPGASHFYLLCLLSFVLFSFRYSGEADGLDLTVYWCSAISLLLLPAAFLHFCLYFPEPLPALGRSPKIKAGLYMPFVILTAVHAIWFAGKLEAMGFPRNQGFADLFDRIHLSYFLFFLSAGALLLTFSQHRCPSILERQQRKWVSYGVWCGILPFGVLYGIPYLAGRDISRFSEASIFSLALIPLSVAYAITRHKLMDVDLIFKRGAAYVLTSSTLLAGYVAFVLLLSRAVEGLSPDASFSLFALSALLLAILFAPLKNKIQEQLDRLFYKDELGYRRSFIEFGRALNSETRLPELTRKLATGIRQMFRQPVAIFLRDESRPGVFPLIHSDGFTHDVPHCVLQLGKDLETGISIPLVGSRAELSEPAHALLMRLGIEYLQPLRVRERVVALLAIGRKNKDRVLNSDDIELLSAFGSYAGIALENALLYQSLQLKASELGLLRRYSENVIESIIVGVAVLTPEGEVTTWNKSMEMLTGYPRDEVLGKRFDHLFPRELVAILKDLDSERPLGGPVHLYQTRMEMGSTPRRLNVTVSPFLSTEDQAAGTLLLFEDVTEKVQLEQQLAQAERLTSIGLFAAGIAHEVNTPLAGIASYAQLLLKETPAEDKHRQALKKIEQQSFRASAILNKLLNFARAGDAEYREVNVNSLMLETLSLLEHQFKKGNVDIQLDLDPAMPKTLGNPGKLQQVFMNLFLNARDAMPDGGKLRLRTYGQDSSLVVEIEDTGIGIARENLRRIYDPFFTTKEVGKGTGLGLSVTYGIIQEHSGQISVESEEGRGTTFHVVLPFRHVN
ncbi:MAG: PAS domain S-box protein [Acidobacteria bacterium]|nr:PAS domain S-box protein [Acidobacteriota bacterium]